MKRHLLSAADLTREDAELVLSTADEMRVLGPSSGPWSVSSPRGVERLAGLGYSPDDLPALRTEAQRMSTDPDPSRRSTT